MVELPNEEDPTPHQWNNTRKSFLKSVLASGLIALLSGAIFDYCPRDSTITCEQFTSVVAKDQFLSSITLNPKAQLNKECIDSLLQHKEEVTHLRVEIYSNMAILLPHLKDLPNLLKLEVVNVQLRYFDLNLVDANTRLTHIVLDNNPGLSITGRTSANITKLSLAHCDLRSVPEVIYDLGNLHELNLHGNRILYTDVNFERLPNLASYNEETL